MLLQHFTIEDFKDTFPLASFVARVCYSDDLNSLLSDPSVFAHSFTYKQVGKDNALRIGASYLKSCYNPNYPDIIGISLRHYLEELLNTDPDHYQNAFNQLAEYDTPLTPIDTYIQDQDLTISLIGLNTDYDGYAVFCIDGISRVATHQLVRHSSLNFSQRSQRYVSGRKTTIVVSGTLDWIKDFIEKRDNAQWEIRNIANIMKYILDKHVCLYIE